VSTRRVIPDGGKSPILVVDDDAVSRHVLAQTLTNAGLDAEEVPSGQAALAWLEQNVPCLVLLDLVMPEPDGFAVLRYIRARPELADVPVVVLTALDADDEVQQVFSSGADDYVHKPFRPAEIVARIRGQLRMRDYVERLSRREHDQQTVLELTQALASTLNIRHILFTVVRRVAEVAHVDRCSIVLVGETEGVGHVIATSDDAELRDLTISLEKYPEIKEVLRTGNTLVIRDATRHPLLEAVRQSEPGLEFTTLALVPISHEQRPMGVIFLRSRVPVAFGDHEIALVHTVANATAIALRNARILKLLRDESMQSAFARVEAERRVRLFQRYADIFESAADGMVVVDLDGKVLFANPRAREILGYDAASIMDVPFVGFLDGPAEPAEQLLAGFTRGVYPPTLDLALRVKAGGSIIASVSFSSVLHEENAILFTFRDVTQERKTAVELRQTKEFLERVIESSVDGIVSADLSGNVLLFNRAASRIFGYSPSDVIGKREVERLYPPGVAREVMRKIRDPNVNGPGRLEGCRVDMISSTGELIPVTLSAALIYENGRVVGSVGIFTDIRDKLRMEAKLSRAQEELRQKEKMAVVAELAGAAAHELNQPLTSVIGYAELLRRSLNQNTELAKAADVIISEAERMAEIVRKIGKITKYETKSYVGGQKILDLEKAAEESEAEARR
jgi:PAS domain S-box-containing protein